MKTSIHLLFLKQNRFFWMVCFAVQNLCFAQTDSLPKTNPKHGVSLGAFVSGVPVYPGYFLCYALQTGKTRFSVGPGFSKGLTIYTTTSKENTNKPIKLNGGTGTVQYFPNAPGKRFDLFFQYEVTAQRFTDQGKFLENGIEKEYSSRDLYIGQYVGYGLEVKFLKHFRLNHTIGFGYLWTKSRFNDVSYSKSYGGISGNTRVGLCFVFPK